MYKLHIENTHCRFQFSTLGISIYADNLSYSDKGQTITVLIYIFIVHILPLVTTLYRYQSQEFNRALPCTISPYVQCTLEKQCTAIHVTIQLWKKTALLQILPTDIFHALSYSTWSTMVRTVTGCLTTPVHHLYQYQHAETRTKWSAFSMGYPINIYKHTHTRTHTYIYIYIIVVWVSLL